MACIYGREMAEITLKRGLAHGSCCLLRCLKRQAPKGGQKKVMGIFAGKNERIWMKGNMQKARERQAWYEVDVIGFPYWTFGLPALDRKAGGGSVRTQDQRGALCLHGARHNVF